MKTASLHGSIHGVSARPCTPASPPRSLNITDTPAALCNKLCNKRAKEKGWPVIRTALSGYHAPDVLLEAAVVQAGVEAVAQIELAHQHVVACHVGFPVLEQLGQFLRMPGSQVAALGRILGQVVQLPLGGAVGRVHVGDLPITLAQSLAAEQFPADG